MAFGLRCWFPALYFLLYICNISAKKEKVFQYKYGQSYTHLLSQLINIQDKRFQKANSLNNPNIIIVTNQFLKNSGIVRRNEHKGTSPNVTAHNPKKKAPKQQTVTEIPGVINLTSKQSNVKQITAASETKATLITTKIPETGDRVNYQDETTISSSSSSETKEEEEDDDTTEEVLREKDSEELDTEKSNTWNKALTKKAATHCTKACKKAAKDVCKDYSCKGGLKKGMRNNCRIKCREYFDCNGGDGGGGGVTKNFNTAVQPYWFNK